MTIRQTASVAFLITGLYLVVTTVPGFLYRVCEFAADRFADQPTGLVSVLLSFVYALASIGLGCVFLCKGQALAHRLFPEPSPEAHGEEETVAASANDLLRAALVFLGIWMFVTGVIGFVNPDSLAYGPPRNPGDEPWRWLLPVLWCGIGAVLFLNPRPVVKYWRWRKRMDARAEAMAVSDARDGGRP